MPSRIALVIIATFTLISVFSTYYYYNTGEEMLKSRRISFLIKNANATKSEAELFDEEYSYLAQGKEYNQTVLNFFHYWRINSSLASTCLSILKDVSKTNIFLSEAEKVAINFISKDDLTLVLSLYTNKEEYIMNEDKTFDLKITVLSSKDLGEVIIEIFGFKSPYRGYVVKNKWINGTDVLKTTIQKGLNLKVFKDIDIPCSPCYGIKSGLNNITCVIKLNNLSLSTTRSFLFKSGS